MSFLSEKSERASHPMNRAKLLSLLPANIKPEWLDSWLAQNPNATVAAACKAILQESNALHRAQAIADKVNESRTKLWKH